MKKGTNTSLPKLKWHPCGYTSPQKPSITHIPSTELAEIYKLPIEKKTSHETAFNWGRSHFISLFPKQVKPLLRARKRLSGEGPRTNRTASLRDAAGPTPPRAAAGGRQPAPCRGRRAPRRPARPGSARRGAGGPRAPPHLGPAVASRRRAAPRRGQREGHVRCTRATARPREGLPLSPGSPAGANGQRQRRTRVHAPVPSLHSRAGRPCPRDRAPARGGQEDTNPPFASALPCSLPFPSAPTPGRDGPPAPGRHPPQDAHGASQLSSQAPSLPGRGDTHRQDPARGGDAPTAPPAPRRIRPPSPAAPTSLHRTPGKPLAGRGSPQRPAHPPTARPAQPAFEPRSSADAARPARPCGRGQWQPAARPPVGAGPRPAAAGAEPSPRLASPRSSVRDGGVPGSCASSSCGAGSRGLARPRRPLPSRGAGPAACLGAGGGAERGRALTARRARHSCGRATVLCSPSERRQGTGSRR